MTSSRPVRTCDIEYGSSLSAEGERRTVTPGTRLRRSEDFGRADSVDAVLPDGLLDLRQSGDKDDIEDYGQGESLGGETKRIMVAGESVLEGFDSILAAFIGRPNEDVMVMKYRDYLRLHCSF